MGEILSRESLNRQRVIDNFARLYCTQDTYYSGKMYWMGIHTGRYPCDLWIIQEILNEVKPDIVIETGTMEGGSALFIAMILQAIGKGKIFTIDIAAHPNRPSHPLISYVIGSSIDDHVFKYVKSYIQPCDQVLVLLDADHRKEHVDKELLLYSDLVTSGSYLILDDTNTNGRPISPGWGPGPGEALDEFLAKDDRFEVDKSREKFLFTYSPNGYLRRK